MDRIIKMWVLLAWILLTQELIEQVNGDNERRQQSSWSCCPPCGDGGVQIRLSRSNNNQNAIETKLYSCPQSSVDDCPVFAHRGCWLKPPDGVDFEQEDASSDSNKNDLIDLLYSYKRTECALLAQRDGYRYFYIQTNRCYLSNDTRIFNNGPVNSTLCEHTGYNSDQVVDMYIIPDCPAESWHKAVKSAGICIADGVENKTYSDAKSWCEKNDSDLISYDYLHHVINGGDYKLPSGTYWLSDKPTNDSLRSCASFKYTLAVYPGCDAQTNNSFICLYNDTLQTVWMDWTEWNVCDAPCNNGTTYRYRYRLAPVAADRVQVDEKSCEVTTCPWNDTTNNSYPKWHGCWKLDSASISNMVPDVEYLRGEAHARTIERCALQALTNNEAGFAYKNRLCYFINITMVSFREHLTNATRSCNSRTSWANYYDVYAFVTPDEVQAEWGVWSSWSQCTLACSTGNRTRTRLCDNPSSNFTNCIGQSSETKFCNKENCPNSEGELLGCVNTPDLSEFTHSLLDGFDPDLRLDAARKCQVVAVKSQSSHYAVGPDGTCYIDNSLPCRTVYNTNDTCGDSRTSLYSISKITEVALPDCDIKALEELSSLADSLRNQTTIDASSAVQYMSNMIDAITGIDGISQAMSENIGEILTMISERILVETEEQANQVVSSVTQTLTKLVTIDSMQDWSKVNNFIVVASSVETLIRKSTDKLTTDTETKIELDQHSFIDMKTVKIDSSTEDYTQSESNLQITLPADVISSGTSLTMIKYENTSALFGQFNMGNNSVSEKTEFGSTVLSISLNTLSHDEYIQTPIKLNIPTIIDKYDNYTEPSLECVFWNTSTRLWSSDGCKSEQTDSGVVCSCHHMTSFAVLMRYTEYAPDDDSHEGLALTWIGYVGTAVSLCCLIAAFVIFIYLDNLKTERKKIHMNLIVALGLSQITHVVGIDLTVDSITCTVIAVLLHYFWMATFTWMLCEGVHLYFKIISVFNSEGKPKRLLYYFIGWGAPVIIVAISLAIRLDGYGTEKFCWLSLDDGLIWAFIGPVCAVTLINFIIMAIVIKIVVSAASTMPAKSQKSVNLIKAGVKGVFILTPILGLTWIFGLLAVNQDLLVFEFLFVIINSLQGLFIFIFHCVGSSEVRLAIRNKRESSSKSFNPNSISRAPKTEQGDMKSESRWSRHVSKFLFRSNKSVTRSKQSQPANSADMIEDLLQGEVGGNLGGLKHMASYDEPHVRSHDSHGNVNPAYDDQGFDDAPPTPIDICWSAHSKKSMSTFSKTTKISNASTELTSLDDDLDIDIEHVYKNDCLEDTRYYMQSSFSGANSGSHSTQTPRPDSGPVESRSSRPSTSSRTRCASLSSQMRSSKPASPPQTLPGLINDDSEYIP